MLSSSTPSFLTPALPFVFVTDNLKVLSPSTLEKGQLPANTQVTKRFWSAHVETINKEFLDVKGMGSATTEEWLKGLEGRGKERQSDATRWENWASSSAFSQMKKVLYPGYQPPTVMQAGTVPGIAAQSSTAPTGQIPGLKPEQTADPSMQDSTSQGQHSTFPPGLFQQPRNGTPVYPSHGMPPGRHERTREEVAELKAARRAEIERRALTLDPPLAANVLAHIPSFQAATQIITPMDDKAWDLLKPRLLTQRAEAERREKESLAQVKIQQEVDEKRNSIVAQKDPQEAIDADWDEVQAPLRGRIAGYADEIIRDGWENGDKVTKETCPRFAVEALIYIRKRFYAEVTKDAAAAQAAGKPPTIDPPQGPFTQKLTLENMKWIFEMKIKPHTEPLRKEIFLCNGCEVTVRSYGFEGVIQHYAAKHTNALSAGNVVVHWRAEWPEHPPFTAEVKVAKNSYQNQGGGHVHPPNGGPAPQYGFNAFQAGPQSIPPQSYQQSYPGSSAPAYGAPPYVDQYPQTGQVAYAPQNGYAPPPGSQNYGQGPGPYPPPDPYQHHAFPPAQGPPLGYQAPTSGPPMPPGPAGQYNYNYGSYQNNNQVGYGAPQGAPQPPYHVQLEDVARNARELWRATSNMQDVHGTVRVQVVIYHLGKRFQSKFSTSLSLAMFDDGLSNNKDMRPVRNVNGLVCKVCRLGIGNYQASEQEQSKAYSLPQLTKHFQTSHIEALLHLDPYATPPDWTTDMVLLPEPVAMSNLPSAVSMDSQKYYLVSEAIPQAFETPTLPQASHNGGPTWQADYQQDYPRPSVDNHAKYYAEPQNHGPPSGDASGPHQNNAAPHSQWEPTRPVVDAVPPNNHYEQPQSAAPSRNTPLGRKDDNGRQPSQGHKQGREQNPRPSKKHKKKGGNSHGNNSAAASKRSEEEEKMAEEEARREEDAIRAMWAQDRAETARKSTRPEEEKSGRAHGKSHKHANSSGQPSKPNTPLPRQNQSQRLQAGPARNSPRTREPSSLMDALESQISQPPPASYRGPAQPNNVIFMDGREDPAPLPREPRRTPEGYARYDPPPRDAGPRRSRSPVYVDYGRPPPVQQYRERTPPRLAAEPVYQSRPPPQPMDDVRYDNRPPLPRDEYDPRGYPEEPPRQRAMEYIEYEIVEVRDPVQGTYIIERPVRRVAAPPERYQQQPPAHYGDPYAREEPLPPREAPEPYHPPYERAYSRAPPPAAYEPPHHQQLQQPPPGSRNEPHQQNPGARNEPHHPPHLSRTDPAYYEEYDPRFPAAPPGAGGPPRQVRYQ